MNFPIRTTARWTVLFSLVFLIPYFGSSQVNNLCANATTIVSSPTCAGVGNNVPGTLTVATTYTAVTAACGSSNRDVWFSFVAKTTNPTISITTSTIPDIAIQLYGNTCATPTNLGCGSTSINATGLTLGATYRIRVYSVSNAVGAFNICVTDPAPVNNEAVGAIELTSGLTCINTTGNMYASTASSNAVAPCTAPVITDVWYKFVASTVEHTITLSGVGAGVGTPRMQLFSGTPAALTSIACGTTSLNPTTLIPGQTYYLRIYQSSGLAPTTNTNAGFSICITHPLSNDDCSGAISLPVNSTCSQTWGTIVNSTVSGVAATCGGAPGVDVWYKFTAVATTATIDVTNFGTNFPTRRLQLFSGNCTSLTSIQCVNGGGGTQSIAATGLTIGTTYYIRVFSSSTTAPTTLGDFSICVRTAATNIPPRYGNSYVNISKQTTGGVVEQGDTLEIRMAVYYQGTTNLYRPRYLDSLPTNTAMVTTGPSANIRVISNEGVAQQTYTLAGGDDAATFVPTPAAGTYHIRMNLGFGAGFLGGVPTANTLTDLGGTASSRMVSSDYPRASGALLFATAFRVRVTGAPGQVIRLGTGKFIYRVGSAAGTELTLNAVPYEILISTPQSLCANATGLNDAEEFSGTFGHGTELARTSDLRYPIDGYTFVTPSQNQAIGDGQYGIVKNMSPRNGTNPNASRQPNCTPTPPVANDQCAMRMFGGYWDILGDHTGTNNSSGNAPPAAATDAGYMLVVNSDNVPSTVYRQSLNNLCPNTYYEFSAWVKNICSVCGVNTLGTQTNLPGVNPNLTFVLDGVDRYSTGEIAYASGWVKKGFVFVTGPSQTSLNLSIRTNSQGGGGNDWAIDDISIATCLPNMSYSPSLNPTVCEGNPLVLYDTIRSYFDNYTHHQWQESADNGLTWSDLGGTRDSVAVFNPGANAYQYVTTYTIPPTSSTDSGKLYRVLVATSSTNLANANCRVTDGVSIINLNVQDCGPVLHTDLFAFNGKLVNDRATLSWITTKEESALTYLVERSSGGNIFTTIGSVPGWNNGSDRNNYSFNDPQDIGGKVWYRIVIVTPAGKKKYSNVIQLRKGMSEFDFGNVVNPFNQSLGYDIVAPANGTIQADIIDMSGHVVRSAKQVVFTGVNSLAIGNTQGLQSGMYTLRVIYKDQVITRRILKTN